jgi:hypothetical protein
MTEPDTLRVVRAVERIVQNDRRRQTLMRQSITTKKVVDEALDRDIQNLKDLLRGKHERNA